MSPEPIYLDTTVDTTPFKGLAKALRKVDPAAKKVLTKGLRAVGTLVSIDAKVRVAELTGPTGGDVASEVAQHVKVLVRDETVAVAVSGLDYPANVMAGLWEKGGHAGPGGWNHPVFGDPGTTVFQKSHPFLLPAAIENAPEIKIAAESAIDAAIAAFEAGLEE